MSPRHGQTAWQHHVPGILGGDDFGSAGDRAGAVAARYQGRWPDKLISGITLATISVPEFVVGYILMFLLAVKFRVLFILCDGA